uniref:Prion protein, related sequence 3 n=1 Tax=Cynoglossus semilaevis TaxID=244447 RepID=A0A3P8WUR7_CYNSE
EEQLLKIIGMLHPQELVSTISRSTGKQIDIIPQGKDGRRAGLNLFKKIFSPKTKSNTFNQPARPGSYANQGGLPNHQPRQPAGGYPAGGYPAGGYPAGGYPAGGYPYSGGYRGYPNPNNRIQSPYLGGGFGYGVYVAGGGSPFSHSVQAMGVYPNEKSKGFGRSAAMAAAQGAVAGMALGYGLGRFPRPHFEFHSPQEEYYYNHYIYRRYGVRSTDDNDYGRDYQYNRPIVMYDNFMDLCVKRMDLLPVVSINSAASKQDTVSIVEIGYPALIQQMKVRRCLELYLVYSEKYLKKKKPTTEHPPKDGTQGLKMGQHAFLAVAISTTLMIMNSNMLPGLD